MYIFLLSIYLSIYPSLYIYTYIHTYIYIYIYLFACRYIHINNKHNLKSTNNKTFVTLKLTHYNVLFLLYFTQLSCRNNETL